MKNQTTEQMILATQETLKRITKMFEDDVERYNLPEEKKQNFFNHFVLEHLAVLYTGIDVASGEYDKKVAKKAAKKANNK